MAPKFSFSRHKILDKDSKEEVRLSHNNSIHTVKINTLRMTEANKDLRVNT